MWRYVSKYLTFRPTHCFMKNFRMTQILLILFFLLGYTLGHAQDYIVTIKGDTLRGKVKYFNNMGVKYSVNTSKYLQLIPKEGKKTTHQVLQTISFRMNDEIYHTIKFEQGYTFMKLLNSGYLSLYAYQQENQTTWDGRYFVKKDGGMMDVPNIGFKKRLTKFLEDCPTVVGKIESGELSRAKLAQLIEEYNTCVESKNAPMDKKPVATNSTWTDLESAVKALPEFDKKSDALDMIREVQNKVSKKESIPSFLINGLKDSLKDQSTVTETLNRALEELN